MDTPSWTAVNQTLPCCKSYFLAIQAPAFNQFPLDVLYLPKSSPQHKAVCVARLSHVLRTWCCLHSRGTDQKIKGKAGGGGAEMNKYGKHKRQNYHEIVSTLCHSFSNILTVLVWAL